MTNARRLRLFLPLPVLAVAALVWPASRPEAAPPRSADEVAYASLPKAPPGEVGVGRAGVEASAVAHAAWLRAVPSAEGSQTPCDPDDLSVSWTEPPTSATHGRFIPPLGPAPRATTEAVNGIVQCEGSEDYAFMGFQARYVDGRWEVQAVPYVAEEDHLEEVTTPEPRAPQAPPVPALTTLDGRTFGAAIEGLAAYEPQRTCSGTAKPGTLAMRNLLLRDNAGSRNLGIVRGCGIGGTSEHKEGRAFDWGVNVGTPRERAYAEAFVSKLLATDEHGNRYALARRMGVMYVIWNRQIWSAYRAGDGWRPYGGASPHTDHVHLSLSWAGANARTSFWSGDVVEVLLAAAPTGDGTAAGPARRRATVRAASVADGGERRAETTAAWQAEKQRRAEARAAWEAERQERTAGEARTEEERDRLRAEAKATWQQEKAAREQAKADAKARWVAEKAAREQAKADAKARWDEERAAREQAKADAKARWDEERAAREQAKADARAEAKARWEAEKAAREQARRETAEEAAAEKAAREQAKREAWEQAKAEREARRRRRMTTEPAPATTAPTTTAAPELAAAEPPATTTTEAG